MAESYVINAVHRAGGAGRGVQRGVPQASFLPVSKRKAALENQGGEE